MKKYGPILSILIVIILIHAVILFSCMYSESRTMTQNGKTDSEEASSRFGESVEPQLPVIAPVPVDAGEGSAASTGTKSPLPAEPPVPFDPNFGKPFIYEYAVMGNIPALPRSRNATSGILVDLTTRNVLWAKNHRKGVPIASMTKIMTCLIAYEDVVAGKYSLDTPVKVSVKAARVGGSQVYLDPRETFSLGELMKAASIKSANDAAYLIAEFIGGGSVQPFVDRMNAKARELRMPGTKFFNPNGLPGSTAAKDNVASPEGMARLAEATLRHRQLMVWASTWMDTFRKKGQKGFMQIKNHNYLLPGSSEAAKGVDGLKTGFINRSGFCLTATCLRDGRRMVAVVTGYPIRRERDRFVRQLLDWGYSRAADPAAALKKDAAQSADRRKKKSSSKVSSRKKVSSSGARRNRKN